MFPFVLLNMKWVILIIKCSTEHPGLPPIWSLSMCGSMYGQITHNSERTLLNLIFKIFKRKNFTFIKSAFLNNLRFFTNEYTHLVKKKVNFYRKVFKMQRYSSVTLHVSPKNPISAKKLKITFTKVQILPPIFFPEWFGPNKLKLHVFEMDFMTNQLNMTVPKKYGFRS